MPILSINIYIKGSQKFTKVKNTCSFTWTFTIKYKSSSYIFYNLSIRISFACIHINFLQSLNLYFNVFCFVALDVVHGFLLYKTEYTRTCTYTKIMAYVQNYVSVGKYLFVYILYALYVYRHNFNNMKSRDYEVCFLQGEV